MKKKFVLVFATMLVLMCTLTACGTSSEELKNLQEELTSMENRIIQLEDKLEYYDNVISGLQANSATVTENSDQSSDTDISEEQISNEELQQLMDYLDQQVASSDVENWIEVANCPYATENHLLIVAENCVNMASYNGYYSQAENGQNVVVDAILSNPQLTDNVLKELTKSEYVSIWLKVLGSDKCYGSTLFDIATNCVNMDSYDGYYSQAENGQNIIVDAILEAPALDDGVLRKLLESEYESIWIKALSSDKCSEETLIEAAQKCVALDSYNGYYYRAEEGQLLIAEAILQNSAITENVLAEFANSEYPSIVSLGHQNIESLVTVTAQN